MEKENSKQTVFKSPTLSISGNGIDCQNTFIHTKNITQMWIGNIPKKPLPIIPVIVLAIVGLALIRESFLIGIVCWGVMAAIIFVYKSQINLYGMNIELTSGRIYSFTSTNKDFLSSAYKCIKNILNKELNIGYTVNLNNGNVTQFNVDRGTVVNAQNSTIGNVTNR